MAVLRRSSGGGTVVQGRGCLNYSFILSKTFHPDIADLRKSYGFILNKVVAVLDSLGVRAVFMPISDIAFVNSQQKFSGNAQKRGKKCVLHHGTILYNFDLMKIDKYLCIPKAQPEYRQARAHLNFVTNVPLAVEAIKKGFYQEFNIQQIDSTLNKTESESLAKLVKDKNVIVNL